MTQTTVQSFETEYAEHRRRGLVQAAIGGGIFLVLFIAAGSISQLSPSRFIEGIGKLGDFFGLMMPDLELQHLFAGVKQEGSFAYWYYGIDKWLKLLGQTIEIAILATAIGITFGFIASFFAARNLGVPPGVVWIVRRTLEVFRTVPELVMALIFVFAFGTGPLAGVLAIAIHTIGVLGKLFSEAHENIHSGAVEGVASAGGSWVERMRFGVMPQIMPNIISYALLRVEINVAASAAIGIVGAGGIGMELRAVIDLGLYQDAFAIILMTIGLIFIIDITSEQLRTRFLKGKAA